MILAYFCTISCWAILIRNWSFVNDLGKVLLTLIAVASITFVLDAHKRRQEASTAHYSDETTCGDPDCFCADSAPFNFYSGEPAINSPYSRLNGWYTSIETVTTTSDGCTDPKTSSRKRDTFLSDFYEFCEENGYSQEERPLVFQEWVND